MERYKNEFLKWLDISWYLLIEPFISLYNLLFEWFAPKWLVYYVIKKRILLSTNWDSDIWTEILKTRVLNRNRITQKQYDKLIDLIQNKTGVE